MRPSFRVLLPVAVLTATPLLAHDLFFELETFFLPPHADVRVELVNGVFGRSDNVITRDRMRDVSVVGPGAGDVAPRPPDSRWRDEGVTIVLDLRTGGPGTYALGVSTRPRVLELEAEAFNEYLEHDGVVDVLAARTRDGHLDRPARERYSKHVKAIVQVGDVRSDAWSRVFGYPVEIVPLANPYELTAGDRLDVRVLRDGEPLADVPVHASHAGHHAHDDSGRHVEAVATRTDAGGTASIGLDAPGRWYVRLIHMVEAPEPDVDYESRWSTLTFEVRESEPEGPGMAVMVVLGAVIVSLVVVLVGRLRPARPGDPEDDGTDADG